MVSYPLKEKPVQQVRKRLTYANVTASLALFLVLAGGSAFAAMELGRESVGTRELKKGAVSLAKLSKAAKKTLKGKAGPRGETGAAGPQGPPGPAIQVLPSGQTATGFWAVGGTTGGLAYDAITFVPKLPQPVPLAKEKYLKMGQSSTECPGFGKAQAGFLCVYTSWENAVTFGAFSNGVSDLASAPATETGAIINFSASTTQSNARGNWAYTAP